MLFMVIEKFRNQDGKAVYPKLREGRGGKTTRAALEPLL